MSHDGMASALLALREGIANMESLLRRRRRAQDAQVFLTAALEVRVYAADLDGPEFAACASPVSALQRLWDGTWGKCRRCGHTIDPHRLEKNPGEEFCAGCGPATRPEVHRCSEGPCVELDLLRRQYDSASSRARSHLKRLSDAAMSLENSRFHTHWDLANESRAARESARMRLCSHILEHGCAPAGRAGLDPDPR